MYKLNAPFSYRNRTWFSVAQTLGLYGLLTGLGWGLEQLSPSGPCTPGPILFVLVGLPVISLVLLIINGGLVVRGQRQHRVSVLLHGLALGGWWLLVH